MLFSAEQAFVGRDEKQATLKMLAWEATKTTEKHGNFNLFHFQYDRMWQVKTTGKTKAWPLNSLIAISLDIVRWPGAISSPVKLLGKCWRDDVAMITAHLSVLNYQMFNKIQAKRSFASIPTWWSIQIVLRCWKIKVPQNIFHKYVSSQILVIRYLFLRALSIFGISKIPTPCLKEALVT